MENVPGIPPESIELVNKFLDARLITQVALAVVAMAVLGMFIAWGMNKLIKQLVKAHEASELRFTQLNNDVKEERAAFTNALTRMTVVMERDQQITVDQGRTLRILARNTNKLSTVVEKDRSDVLSAVNVGFISVDKQLQVQTEALVTVSEHLKTLSNAIPKQGEISEDLRQIVNGALMPLVTTLTQIAEYVDRDDKQRASIAEELRSMTIKLVKIFECVSHKVADAAETNEVSAQPSLLTPAGATA